ncbi:MAG: rhomboid family intramembrane serine protease [Thermoguttaceae bacterium]
MIGTLVLINVVLYVANALLGEPTPAKPLGNISSFLAVYVETLVQPLSWWRFLTYGFVHAYQPGHIIWNMLTLWFLGQDVERTYGRNEFLRFYLVALVVGSVAWAVANRLMGVVESGPLVGASGAVTAVVILFALLFPHRTLLLFFVLPVPAWFVGLLFVGTDIYTALHGETQIAWGVHLAGAGFALAYYRFQWNFGRLLPNRFSLGWLQPPSRLRVVDPDEEEDDDRLNEEVDRILEKISREGETNLSRKERRTLQNASREYQRRRRKSDSNPL